MIVEWIPMTQDGYQDALVGQIVDVDGMGEGKVSRHRTKPLVSQSHNVRAIPGDGFQQGKIRHQHSHD